MMIPQYPKNSYLVEDWCKHFSKALFTTFQRGLKLDIKTCSSSSLSFCSIENKEKFVIFIVPKPPNEDIGNIQTYRLWNSVFSRFLLDVQDSGFTVTTLLEHEQDFDLPLLYDIDQRYFVFKKEDVIPPLMCKVCYNKTPDAARIYCGNGHWFCLDCCQSLVAMGKACPVCREPSSHDQCYLLQKIVF